MAKVTVKQFSADGIDISKKRDHKIKVALSSPEALHRFRDLVDSTFFKLHGKLSSKDKEFLEGNAQTYGVHRLDAEDILKNIFTTEVAMAKASEETEEAVAVYDEVIKRFGTATEPALRELARATRLLAKACR